MRLRAREEQLVTDVLTLQNRDTESQGQLQNLRHENDRINASMNQIQITNNSMNTWNQEMTQQLQTSNFERSRSQTEVSGWNQSTESRDAENLDRKKHRHSSEIDLQPTRGRS